MQAFRKLLEKTFDEFTFEEFASEFGGEFSHQHRDYLLDLYAQFVQTTRSNSEVGLHQRSRTSAESCLGFRV